MRDETAEIPSYHAMPCRAFARIELRCVSAKDYALWRGPRTSRLINWAISWNGQHMETKPGDETDLLNVVLVHSLDS
jgi:hypothetical protein